MISKAYLSLLQFLFLALFAHAIPEAYLHDTTDIPDEQKDIKDTDISGGETHIFPPLPEYIFPPLPDFSYDVNFPGKKGSPLDDSYVGVLDDRGDVAFDNGDMSKRGNHRSRQGGQKFRFDPALNRLGLGKRDSDRPKYNPGWKFIGLGKRLMPFLHGSDPLAFDSGRMEGDFKAGVSDVLPYYRLHQALHDATMFLDNFKERFQDNLHSGNQNQSSAPDRPPLDLYSLAMNEETSPKVKHSMSGIFAARSQNGNFLRSYKPQPLFTRSRKPTAMWRNKSKPMYDPGYLMTGLGK